MNTVLEEIFQPESIAIVGASGKLFDVHTTMFLESLVTFGYRGGIYPVNPKYQEICGFRAYPTILDIPGPVDHVISLVPAPATIRVMQDCVDKGVKSVHIFTAGFAETGQPDAGRLQDQLVSTARTRGIRILGPNCTGFYCPRSGISYCSDFPKDAGQVGFVAQSGSYTYLLVRNAAQRGVRFSKVVSYGNGSDIDEVDLLQYFAEDAETKVICAYIEGAKDGRALVGALRRAAGLKPTVVMKGGETEGGIRGTIGHTGSSTSQKAIWDAAIRQTGVIRADSIDEMIDVLVTLLFLQVAGDRRAAVVGTGGGVSVRAADECEEGGLVLSPTSDDFKRQLNRVVPYAGTVLDNPFDLPGPDLDVWARVLDLLETWEDVDIILWQICPEIEPFRDGEFRQLPIEIQRMVAFSQLSKPTLVVVHGVGTETGMESMKTMRSLCRDHGIPFYPSLRRASVAIAKCARYLD